MKGMGMFSLRMIAKRLGLRQAFTFLGSLLPYKPIIVPPAHWDKAWKRGVWDRIRVEPTSASYRLLSGTCEAFLLNDGALLDLGCGEGLFPQQFCRELSFAYTGVDISSEAIERAEARADARHEFFVAGIESFVPSRKFNVILFQECLCYFPRPVEIMRRYADYLKSNGVLIVSLYHASSTLKLFRQLDKEFDVVYRVDRFGRDQRPDGRIKVYAPRVRCM